MQTLGADTSSSGSSFCDVEVQYLHATVSNVPPRLAPLHRESRNKLYVSHWDTLFRAVADRYHAVAVAKEIHPCVQFYCLKKAPRLRTLCIPKDAMQ